MLLTHFLFLDNVIDNCLFVVIVFFGKQDIFCTVCDTTPQGNVACVTSHNFDNAASLMGSRSISYLVNRFHSGVDCGIKTDGVIGTCNIEVNGTGKTDCVDAVSGQCLRAAVGTVAADNNQAVDTVLSADIRSDLLYFGVLEFQTSCGS